ncbi:MAG: NHLP family bacteriocin export ABC transporter peptidase/permease/ATPase subunit [Christensenellaceae bacterium]|nr:NHLP family bacteriocin export ABC transporter peptidase/permease/ATPase subunit [Christensenellaceae bacterium]
MSKSYVKVPVVMQMEAQECGAACLAMVLAYHKKWLPLEKVRGDCGVSRDGSSAKNVLLAARSYGLNANGYRMEPEQLAAQGTFPCIIHWNFNHFVVLNGFKRGKAVLNDPARGTVEVPLKQFDEAFTGVVLMFTPTAAFRPGGKPKSVMSFVQKRLRGAGVALAFAISVSVIGALTGVASTVFSRVFMDRLLTRQNPDWLMPFLIALTAFSALTLITDFIRTHHALKIEGKLAITANANFMWHVLRLPMEFFSQRMAGDISMRQGENEAVASSLVARIAPLLLDFVMLVFYLTVMLRYSAMLTLVGIASLAINLLAGRYVAQKRVNLTRVTMRDSGKLAGTTVAGVEMIETIKASGAENGYFERWAGYQASVNAQGVEAMKLTQYWGSIPGLVGQLTNLAILMLGTMLIMNGEFTVGMLLAFQGFLSSFMAPAQSFLNLNQSILEMRTGMERIEDVMEYPADVHYTPAEELLKQDFFKLSGALTMEKVTFGYSPLGEALIEDFDLTLKPGSRVAFVGPSGCGKSTLAKLISGLYRPWRGAIKFDGKSIGEIPREVLTGSLGVVDQDIILFEDTIAANIKMWDSSIEDFEMILAARDASLHEVIMGRDGGYQYKIMENGKDFSGGQRQRMEIARVLAQDPTIIIMDEATSALDAKTEFDVIKSIRDRGITCVVVAHRLSAIRDCDEIIVMDKGKVVERGTHDALYALNGVYTNLVSNE